STLISSTGRASRPAGSRAQPCRREPRWSPTRRRRLAASATTRSCWCWRYPMGRGRSSFPSRRAARARRHTSCSGSRHMARRLLTLVAMLWMLAALTGFPQLLDTDVLRRLATYYFLGLLALQIIPLVMTYNGSFGHRLHPINVAYMAL